MTSQLLRPVASVEVDADTVVAAAGSITLDSGAVPYAQASVELPLLDDAALGWLDPRDLVRVPVTAGHAGGTPRLFDLGLRARTVDHVAKTVTLDLASDEAILGDYRTLVADTGARVHQASLRAVCNYVLGKIGASLEPGSDDADVTAYWPVTNLIFDSGFEESVSGVFANGTNATGFARQSTHKWQGVYAGHWQSVAAGSSFASMTGPIGVRAGTSYVFSAYVRASVSRPFRLMVRFEDSAGRIIAYSFMDPAVSVGTTWTRISHIRVAPPGTSRVTLHVEYQANAAGQFPYIDGLMFHEGTEVIPYFNGGTADDGDYEYEFSGDTDDSVSTRIPVVERSPDLFIWKPGVSAWDFLMPITSSAGMVLWCDELRQWRLSLPENRSLPALVNIAASNTRDGRDVLSREDDEAYVTGVVVQYKWTDDDNTQREEYDSAGTNDKVMVVPLAAPYPGPGAAAAILARRQGTGRKQDVTAVSAWDTTPGMTANVSLPGAPDVTGRVTSVTFSLDDGFMDLGTAGLVDIVAGSIAALDGTIDGLVGTIDSL